jgi:serine/threonine protein kinase
MIMEEVGTMLRLNRLSSRNLLRFVAAHEDFSTTTQCNRLTIVSELCSGGELFDRIVKVGHYDEAGASLLIAKLAMALDSMHTVGIIHRDIKPENILYAGPAADAEPVIADFGLAKSMAAVEASPPLVGTPGYLSPEIADAVLDDYRKHVTNPIDLLSSREREVLQMIAESKTNKEIATTLSLSVYSVEAHRGRIMEKLNMHSISELVRFAFRNGLID